MLFVVCAFVVATAAHGGEEEALARLIQPDFRALSEHLGVALSYRGDTAFRQDLAAHQLGGAFTGPRFANELPAASAGQWIDGVGINGFHAELPRTAVSLTGIDLQLRLVDGGDHRPSFDLGGSLARLDGADRLDFNSRGLDVTVSQGFSLATPYAGFGRVWVESTPNQAFATDTERFSMNKYFVGARFQVGLANLALEADHTGDDTTLGARFGFRF